MKKIIIKISISLLLAGFIALSMSPLSCKLTPEGIKLITGDYKSPELQKVFLNKNNNLEVSFSKKINLLTYSIEPHIESSSSIVEESENLCKLKLELFSELSPGSKYSLFGMVKDEIGNTLTFSVPFYGINNSVPELEIVELHSQNGKYSLNGNPVLLTEYVVIKAKTSGNLAGLVLCSAYDGEKKDYLFPSVKIKEGEIIVLHLRSNEEGCINETGDNLDESTAGFSKPGVRDLWDENNVARLGDKIDVVLIKNSYDDSILDGIMYASSDNLDWSKELMYTYAQKLVESGIWKSTSVLEAVKTDSLSVTKCMVKTGSGNSGDSWRIGVCKENAAKL